MSGDVSKQLKQLMAEGLTIEQAARAMGVELDQASLAMFAEQHRTKPTSIPELLERFKPECIDILMSIARGYGNEVRPADQVKACQILLEGRGVMPEISISSAANLTRKFEDMKRITLASEPIDVPEISFGK